MKGYSIFWRSLELKPHHQMPFNVILRTPTLGEGKSYPSTKDTVSVFKTSLTGCLYICLYVYNELHVIKRDREFNNYVFP